MIEESVQMETGSLKAINASRASIYSFLSGIYSKELSVDQLLELKSGTGPIEKLSTLAKTGDEKEILKGIELIKDYFASVTDNMKIVELDLKEDYAGLFLGVRGKIQHPSESVYLAGGRIMQRPQREVRKMYRETNLVVDSGFTEPEDHIATELSFMSHLIQESDKALKEQNDDKAKRYFNTERKFLEQHILKWVPTLCNDVQQIARTKFYRGIAIITRTFLRLDQAFIENFNDVQSK